MHVLADRLPKEATTHFKKGRELLREAKDRPQPSRGRGEGGQADSG
jgi:hypothetical protein